VSFRNDLAEIARIGEPLAAERIGKRGFAAAIASRIVVEAIVRARPELILEGLRAARLPIAEFFYEDFIAPLLRALLARTQGREPDAPGVRAGSPPRPNIVVLVGGPALFAAGIFID